MSGAVRERLPPEAEPLVFGLVPLFLLLLSAFLPMEHDRSVAGEVSKSDELAPALLFLLLLAPLAALWVFTLKAILQRKPPPRSLLLLVLVHTGLLALGSGCLLFAAITMDHGAREEPLVWLACPLCFAAVALVVASLRLRGFAGYRRLYAALAPLHLAASLLLISQLRGGAPLGLRAYLSAAGMLAPLAAYLLWPRKGRAPSPG